MPPALIPKNGDRSVFARTCWLAGNTMGCVHRAAGPDDAGRRAIVGSRQRRAALVAAAAFVAVLLGVTTGATQALDRAAVDWLRPDDEWGTTQQRLLPVIDGLEPRRAYVAAGARDGRRLPAAPHVAPCRVRRARRGTSMGATSVVKVLTHRVDPHGDVASTGGSFPSGHMVALVACLGCCVLLCFRRTRWWHWVLVSVPSAAMAAALLYTAAHWGSDVLAGALLAVAALCWAASWPLRMGVTEPRRVARAAMAERRRGRQPLTNRGRIPNLGVCTGRSPRSGQRAGTVVLVTRSVSLSGPGGWTP